MEGEGRRVLARAGLSAEEVDVRRTADMRLYGQAHQISVPIPAGSLVEVAESAVADAFESAYRALYGRTAPGVAVEAISWRVTVSGPLPSLGLRPVVTTAADAIKGRREVYFPEAGFVSTPVYDRYALAPGAAFDGPAVIEERESTAIVGPGGRVSVDERASLSITLPDGIGGA